MAFLQVVHVAVVADGGVAAAGAVLVGRLVGGGSGSRSGGAGTSAHGVSPLVGVDEAEVFSSGRRRQARGLR